MLAGQTPSRPLLALKGAVLLVLASQVNISLFENGFVVSAAVMLLPLFVFLEPAYPVFTTAVFGGAGVFALRALLHGAMGLPLPGAVAAYAPEMVFFIVYGGLLAGYLRFVRLRPFRFWAMLPLVGVDFAANLSELLVRYGGGAFHSFRLLVILGAALGRSLLIAVLLWTLDSYGVALTRRESAERYRRLVLMTAALKGELAWLRKNAGLIEGAMSDAYGLYDTLNTRQPELAQKALGVAKDIHDVKKEYLLIIRGVEEALGAETETGGMYLAEVLEIVCQGMNRAAAEAGREIHWDIQCADKLYTRQQYPLMAVFQNLFSNALEAAQEGSVDILVVQEQAGDEIVFTVRDNAGGIPEELLSKVFLPGFSTRMDNQTGQMNRGLGLPLVADLVRETLGGSLAVHSGEGGTEFVLRLPGERLVEE